MVGLTGSGRQYLELLRNGKGTVIRYCVRYTCCVHVPWRVKHRDWAETLPSVPCTESVSSHKSVLERQAIKPVNLMYVTCCGGIQFIV